MSTGVVTHPAIEESPQFKARMAGVFQLLEAITAAYGQVIVLNNLFVDGNAAATAANILGHVQLYWVGYASQLLGVVCHVAWALLMYELLKPVNRTLSLLATFIVLVCCAIQAFSSLFYIAPLFILQGGGGLSAFTPEQLQSLAYMFLRLNAYSFHIDHVFFGLWCFLTGYLIYKSTFLPRVLGVLVTISGLGWMVYLSPPLASYLFIPYIAAASALGEIPLEFWLIIKGVNVQRWQEQASAARSRDEA